MNSPKVETRKDKIIKKYLEIQNEIKTITDKTILPHLDSFDIVDLILYIDYIISSSDLRETALTLIKQNKIELTEEEIETIRNILLEY
jgi:acyl carrier protein